MSKLITPAEKRAGTRKILTVVVIPAVALWMLAKLTAGAPGLGAILTAAALAGLTVLATRYDPAEQAGPDRGRVLSADVTLALAAVFGLLTAGRAGVYGPAVVGPVVLVILGLATHRLAADGSRAAAVVAAYRIAWRTRRADAAVALVAGLAVGTGIALTGMNVGGLLAAVVVLAPAGRLYTAARAEQDLRAAVEAALAGVLTGGPAWTPVMANAGRAPIRRFQSDAGTPTEIVLPLPPAATATRQEDLEAEIGSRMEPFGRYIIRFAAGRDRKATVTLVEPLPARLTYDGRAAVDGTKVWIGTGMATREHRHAPGTPGIANGAPFDFTWDLRSEPHGIAVGLTGSGKSQTIQLVMMQLALAGWAMVLIDPKKVEFSGWVGRPGVLRVTTDLEAHVEALEAARVEMDSRYSGMTAAGVNHIDLLPVEQRPRRLLVVVDEVVELLSPAQGKTDTAKAANELKGRAQEAISSILRLGRAAGCHLLIAGQRADRSILTGEAQNNLAFKIIQGRSEQIERTMIGLGDVIATPGVAGRAVARTLRVPQSELQVAYIDLQDLDRYVPVGGVQPEAVHPEHPDLTVPDVVAPSVPVQPVRTGLPPARDLNAPDDVPAAPEGDGDDKDKPTYRFKTAQPYAPGEAQEALDTLIGLPGVKREVGELRASVEMAMERVSHGIGDGKVDLSHLVFAGAPGTGKTTVARIVGSLLRDVGALTSGHVVEVDRSDLVGQYLGQTAPRVAAFFEASKGGIAFVDEAYSLASGDAFGKEAIDALVKRSEDDRGQVLVILAGYTSQMEDLLDTNPGLRSRFPGRITFEDYDDESLTRIYRLMTGQRHRTLDDEAETVLAKVIAAAPRGKDWGNARSVRVLVDAACRAADTRLTGMPIRSRDDLITLTEEDIRTGAARVAAQATTADPAEPDADVEPDETDGADWLASLLDNDDPAKV